MKHPTFPTGLPGRDGDVTDKPGRDHLRHYGDTAYRGMDKVVGRIDARISVTRKPGKDLTPTSGNTTGLHSRIRIRVENAIRRIKIFRIVEEKYRNRRNKYDLNHGHSLRGGQPGHPVEESRVPLRGTAAGRLGAGAARFLITDHLSIWVLWRYRGLY